MRLTTKYSFFLPCVVLLLLYDTDKTLASGSSCRTGCSGSSNSLIKLDEGTTYVYNLEGLTETSLPRSKGPNGESVKLNLKAKVEVTALPQCATLIKLKGVQVTGPDNKKHASLEKLEAHPLLVSLNGGKLDSEVCAAPEDDYTSLNIKRAVASLFQANTNEDGGSSNEIDVFGSCPTDFHIRKEGDVVIVHKRRNLNYCKYREGLHQLWFAVPHGHSSDSQTTPLLEPDFESEQKIQNKILESAVVKESYLFKPFSNRDNGARTKVVTKLTLESKSAGAAPAHKNNQPRSIIFEDPHDTVQASLADVQKALQKVVDSGEAVPTTAAHDFEDLVELTRHASKDDLISIYGTAKSGAGFKNKDFAKKVFIDALFQARSAESVSVAIELLKNHEIDGILANAWYLSFAFVRHTNAGALASAASLLDEPKLPHAAYLGVGALAGQYCREHVCESVPELNQLLSKLAKNIENPTKEKEHVVLASLKGLKNAKHLNDDAANKVIQVVKDGKVSTRVRAAALEAARADSCRGKIQKAAGDVLANREEDSELRIKAYLVLAECPNSKIATKLNELLETETVNQVGAFTTSHLRNLRASVNPDKENAREVLYNVRSKKKFPIDIRKFSQNHELSQRFDALSTSASLESNVIYSQKSYLPRSASLNLTTEVFGQAFNLFEINGRAENLDRVVERIFGPKGYVRTHKTEEIIREGKEGFTKWGNIISDKLKNTVRGKRSVTKAQTDAFGSKVKLYNNELDKNIDVDLSLNLLGNELVWLHLDDERGINPNEILDKLSNLVNKELGKIKDFNHDFKNHYHFLDTKLSYPTATGLPLKLTAHGSAVGHVKLGGSLDFGTILKDPKNGEFRFKIIPSASVEVTGSLSVDAYAVEAGLKVVGNLHTATGTDIHLKLLDGHGFDLNIGLPVKNSDVLTVSSEVVATARERGHNPVDQKLEFNLPRKDFHGCFDQLQTLVGLTLCSDVGFPMDQQPLATNAALYPLNGPSKVSVRVDKDDESLKSYHLKFYFNIEDPKNRKLEIKINTPGSKTPRELSLLASAVTEPNKAVSVHFVSPIHTFSVEGAIVENDKEYSISGSVNLDSNIMYKARLGVLINGATYTPILEYTPVGGNQVDVKVEGTVTVQKEGGRRKYTFNNVRIIANKIPYSVDGTIIRDVNSFATDLKLGYDKFTIGVKSKIQRQGERNLKVNAEVIPSQYSDFSFALKYEYQRDDTHVENSLIFVHGPDLQSKHHRLTAFQQTHYKGQSPTSFDVSTKNTLTYPLFEVEGKFEAALTKKSVNYDLELSYAKQKVRSKLNAKTSVNKFGDYEINFLAAAADREITAEAKREILDTYKSKFSNKLELKPGGRYELNGEVTHQFRPNDINGRLVGQLVIPDVADDYKVDVGLITNVAVFDGHTKIAVGANEYIHAVLKFARKAPLAGNFKLNVRNVVESHGDYKYGEGKGNGAALIHVLPLKRKIKGSADLNVAGSKHTGVIEVFWDADKDNSKKLHIETDTDLTKSSINSKNKVQLLDKQLKVNFNGDCEGKPLNGKNSGGFEVTIPSGRLFTGKFREALQVVPAASNVEFFLELGTAEKEGAHPTKIYLDTYAKNVDTKRYQADTKLEGGYECHSGKHVYSQTLTSKPQDGKLNIDFQNSLTGVGDKPIHSKGNLVLGRPDSSYIVAVVVGEYTVDSTAKWHREHNHFEVEHRTEVKTPLEVVKHVLVKDKYHFHKGDETTPYQANINEEIVFNDKTFKLEGAAEVHPKHGFVKGSTLLPGSSNPISVDASYKHETGANDVRKAEVNFKGSYDKDKNVDWNAKFDYSRDLGVIGTHIVGKTPYEGIKTVDLQLTYKRLSSVSRNTDVKLSLNGQKIDGKANIDLTPNHPVIDLVLNHPAGKSRFYYKLDRKSDRQADSEGQIIWNRNGGGQLDFNSKVDLESLDNFIVTVYVNSEKLNVNKLKLELGNRLTKGGAAKRINFSAQTSDKKGFSGSVSYAVKESDVGFTIDGKGNLEIQNEKHPLTYKAVFKRLSKTSDKEVGTSFNLNADYGKGKLDIIHKITDKEFNYKTNVCYNGCALFEIKSRLDIIDLIEIKHEALFTYDNKLNGRSDSLTVHSKTHRRGIYVDHETGLKVKEVKYGLKTYLHEQDTALVIELPTREIEAKASYELPLIGKKQSAPNTFTARLDGSLALDKKKAPKDVANFLAVGELTTAQKAGSINAEMKFSHPSLQKDMVIRAKASAGLEKRVAEASVELDIFNKKNEKVTASARVDHERVKNGHKYTVGADYISKGLSFDLGSTAYAFSNAQEYSAGASAYYSDEKGVKKEYGAAVEGSPTRFLATVNVPNRQLARLGAQVKVTKEQQSLEIEFDDLAKPAVLKLDAIGYKTIKGAVYHKNNPKVRLEGKIEIGSKQVEARAEKVEDATRHNLFFVVVNLDDAKPVYELHSENMKKVIGAMKANADKSVAEYQALVKVLTEELVKELKTLLESFKKATPNLKPLLDQYKAQFEAIRNELEQDPEFKKLAEFLRKIIGGLVQALEERTKKIVEIFNKLQSEIAEIQEKAIASYNKLLPDITKTYEKVLQSATLIFQRVTELVTVVATRILEIIRQNDADIKQVVASLSEAFQDLSKASLGTINKLRHEIEDFIQLVFDQIKAMPIYSDIRDKYGDLANLELPEQFWHFYSEFTFAVEDFLPTAELKALAKSIFSYIEKRLRKQQVDDAAAIRAISEDAIKAFRSILTQLKAQHLLDDPMEFLRWDLGKLPLPFGLGKLPVIKSIGDLSILRHLQSLSDLPSVADYYYTYRPTLNPLDYVPPYKANAYILGSHHFFTFDRKHVAFKGSCSYVLAQDFLDGNFSIVANLENGKLKSLTINDRTDTVEWLHDNTVLVNGKAGDFPVNHNDFHGWREYGYSSIKNKAGIYIKRIINLDLVIVQVSGFYFGRTRGLLGTINNEHYDEFTLPNGHIAKDSAEFANAYKVVDSCAPVPEMKHTGTHAPECTKFFTSDSSLRTSFSYINPDIYREACDQHVSMGSSDKVKAACEVVGAYVTALKREHVPFVSVPTECVKCTVEGKTVDYGHYNTVTFPNGKADVIFVVEQSTHNSPVFKELITPLITTLSQDLKEKGLADTEFVVIGYGGPEQKWPHIYGNNGKLTYEGKADNIVFGESEKLSPPFDTLEKKIKWLYNYFKIEFGQEQVVFAMNTANKYPFRQGAAKIIVLVNSTPCSKSPTFPVSLQLIRALEVRKWYKDHGLDFYEIFPLAGLTVSNTADQKTKNIVGFDQDKIFTLADAKKKPLEGDATDRPKLDFQTDLCLDFSQYYGGAAFSSQNFLDAKPDQKKKFVHVVSQRIAQGATAYKYTEDCTCTLYKGLYAYHECKVSNKEHAR